MVASIPVIIKFAAQKIKREQVTNTPDQQKTTICILRHGETDWNAQGKLQGREDVELNNAGRAQAQDISEYFKTEPWDVVVSSPLKRAYETAQIIATNIGIAKVHVFQEIIERDYGSASGLLPEERKAKFPDGSPDQEDFEHLRVRAMDGITKIATEFAGKKIIVVAHGGLTNSILYTLSSGAFGSFKTRLKNGCINKIIYTNNHWIVDFYNKTAEELLNPKDYQKKLYSEDDLQTMRLAETSKLPGKNRIDEIMNYAEKAGIKRIGIANCMALQREAEILKARLSEKFEVYSIDCKVGKLTSAELTGTDAKGLSCNPAGQADFLSQQQTELNISLGLCLGHDMVFSQKSKAPTTTLIVKDREHKHNPYKEFE
jgi:uncharacterized phosphatase